MDNPDQKVIFQISSNQKNGVTALNFTFIMAEHRARYFTLDSISCLNKYKGTGLVESF